MVNIPTQDILSMVLTPKHPIQNNSQNVINYCVLTKKEQHIDLFSIVNKNLFNNIIDLVPQLNIDKFCDFKYNRVFNVRAEGEFFVKTSAYKSSLELKNARNLAIEDDIRFQLNNGTNAETCPELQSIFEFLNISEKEFLHAFVTEGKGLKDIYTREKPTLPNLEQLKNQQITKIIELIEGMPEEEYDPSTTTDINNFIDNAFQNLSNDIAVKFERVENCNDATIAIQPGINENSTGGESLYYTDNMITLNLLSTPVPIGALHNSQKHWSEFFHSMTHNSLDHPCEDGFYSCNQNKLEKEHGDSALLSALSGNNKYMVQSFLPWDLAAMRYSYGMPQAKNITYKFSSSIDLENIFGYKLNDQALITLSNVGNTEIDISDVKSYAIDLRYDHRSNITTQDINSSFLLSYDTEVSQIIVNKQGSIALSDSFKTDIILQPGCYDVILHGENYQNDIIKHFDGVNKEICEQIDVYNYNSSLHGIVLQSEIGYFDN